MRAIFTGLVLLFVSATTSARASDGMSAPGSAFAEAVPAATHATTAEDAGTSLTVQEVVIGSLIVGGAFAVGVLATGSLVTGISAAGATVLTYTFLP